jgi:tetratricopeptide (TPR) repeat protein
VDKAKLYAAADKFLAKGANEKALEIFEQILSLDHHDLKALSKASDLYLKLGNLAKAIECLRRIADIFTRDGFYSKAVAILKRILKINEGAPKADLVRIHEQLANLYSQLGLVSEAMSHYKIVVDFLDQTKDKVALLEVLRRISELDPHNPESQMKLIELFVAEGREDEARSCLRKLCEALSSKGQWIDVVHAYERWVQLFPKDFKALDFLVRSYLKIGEPKRALGRLQTAFRSDPHNTAVLELLSKTFLDMKQPEKAKAVDVELVKIYRKLGDEKNILITEERVRGGGHLSSTGSQARSQIAMKPEAIDPGDELIAKSNLDLDEKKVISECDVYLKYGLAEKAREVLASQLNRFPKSLALRWKLKSVLQELRLREELAHSLSEILLLAKEVRSTEWMKLATDELRSVDPKHPSLDTNPMELSFARSNLEDEPTRRADLRETAQEVFGEDLDDSDISIIVDEDIISKSQPQPEFAKESVMDNDDELLLQAERVSDQQKKSKSASEEIVEDELQDFLLVEEATPAANSHELEELSDQAISDDSGSETIELNTMMDMDSDPEPAEPFEPAEDVAEAEPSSSQEASFLLSDSDFSDEELKQLESQLDSAVEKPQSAPEEEATVSLVEPAPLLSPSKEVEIEALGTKMKFSLQEDLRSDAEGDFFDLAAELEEELTGKSLVPAEVRDVFDAFKKGVGESVSAEDFETHYDLGIAYREMGLLDDAIAEFALCAKIPGRFATSNYQLGLCEMGRSNWSRAQEYFYAALQRPQLEPQEKISLSYELAEVLMMLGNSQRAALLYEEVQKLDPTFREVGERIKSCRTS